MYLRFKKQHHSILSFPDTEISSDFVVITGINGAGKTHLLQAIENGHLSIDGIKPNAPQIRLFHHTSMLPRDNANADPAALWQARTQLMESARGVVQRYHDRIRSRLLKRGIQSEHLEDFRAIAGWDLQDVAKIIGDQTKANEILIDLTRHLQQADSEIVGHWNSDPLKRAISTAIKNKCKYIVALSEQEMRDTIPITWRPTDVFQQDFAAVFAMYHRLWERNRMNRYYCEKYGEARPWESDEDFIARYGPPPWDVVNRILSEASLPLEVNKPVGDSDEHFTLKLFHKVLDRHVKYETLSSGEQIIISLAHCLYHVHASNPSIQLPDVLLLDEPDAPLHPSMARSFMRVIDEVLVRERGVKVIMTTHSPSTIAFAPEASIYKLERVPSWTAPVLATRWFGGDVFDLFGIDAQVV